MSSENVLRRGRASVPAVVVLRTSRGRRRLVVGGNDIPARASRITALALQTVGQVVGPLHWLLGR